MTQLQGKVALVTGATGFLGGVVCQRLSQEGMLVRALARRPERDRYIRDLPNVQVVLGDVTDANRMMEVTQGCDYVFHCAAAFAGSLEDHRVVNTDGTRHLVQAAAQVDVTRFIHVSTIALYGYRNRTDVTEETPPNPGHDPYHITKLEAEQEVQASTAENGLSYSILRPGMIYGPRSGMWTDFAFKVARRRPTIFIGGGHGSAYPIHVDDVVDLMVTMAIHPAAEGEIFNCTPDPSPTFREYLRGYAALIATSDKKHRWVGIPPFIVRPIVTTMALFAPKHSQTRDLPDLLTFMQQNITYKMDKARDVLGWQPKVSLEEGIQSCVPYLHEKGLLV